MPRTLSKSQLILLSIVAGVVITIVLAIIAFQGDSRTWGCTFAWQACLVQKVIHTPDNPVREASPIDLFAFIFGLLLGVPIYSLFTYFVYCGGQNRHARTPANSAAQPNKSLDRSGGSVFRIKLL